MKLTLMLIAATLLTGCDLKVDVPVLPNIEADLKKGNNSGVSGLTETSRSETERESKKLVVNLTLSPEVANELDLDAEINCVQAAELSNGAVVLDFIGSACPAAEGLAPASQIVFSASFESRPGDRYEIKYEKASVGSMQLNPDGTVLTLEELCSGDYLTYCFQPITNKQFQRAPKIL